MTDKLTPFIEFWQAYPNKKAKGAVEKKYQKIDADTHQMIMLAIDAQKRMRRELEKTGKFCADWKHPTTWLNQQCWLDEFETSHTELKKEQKTLLCHCGKPLPCETHFYNDQTCQSLTAEARRQRFNELGIQKGPDGWREPCLKAMYKINPRLANLLNRGTQ